MLVLRCTHTRTRFAFTLLLYRFASMALLSRDLITYSFCWMESLVVGDMDCAVHEKDVIFSKAIGPSLRKHFLAQTRTSTRTFSRALPAARRQGFLGGGKSPLTRGRVLLPCLRHGKECRKSPSTSCTCIVSRRGNVGIVYGSNDVVLKKMPSFHVPFAPDPKKI